MVITENVESIKMDQEVGEKSPHNQNTRRQSLLETLLYFPSLLLCIFNIRNCCVCDFAEDTFLLNC